jgi:outer membrane protein OmpA-like peptidoglycan-associated protein
MRGSIILATTAWIAAGAALPALGQAQQNPNSDQIVKSLSPTTGMSESTRGIRIGNPSAGQPAPAHGATPAVEKAPSTSLHIDFASGSAALSPGAMHALDELGRALKTANLASYHFRVEGHTDTVGSADMNKTLSERRAAAVVDYLTSKYQIDPSRLQAVGMGEDGLLVSTPDQTAEPRNRRVVVVNIGT